MITDYFLGNNIYTLVYDCRDNVYKVECFSKISKIHYNTYKKDEIKKILEFLSKHFDNVKKYKVKESF